MHLQSRKIPRICSRDRLLICRNRSNYLDRDVDEIVDDPVHHTHSAHAMTEDLPVLDPAPLIFHFLFGGNRYGEIRLLAFVRLLIWYS